MFSPHSGRKVFWRCGSGHLYPARIGDRTRGLEYISENQKSRNKKNTSCPFCSGRKTSPENNVTVFYPGIRKYWDYNNNAFLPEECSKSDSREIFFICENGHSFPKSMKNFLISKNVNCPTCLDQSLPNPPKKLKL